jgi:glycosyltransferase involved in cell wall biosynthesis
MYFNLNFGRLKKRGKIPKIEILFSGFLMNWRNYTHKNGDNYEYDLMMGDVIEEAEKKFSVYCMDNIITLRPKALTYRKYDQSKNWVCFEEFIAFRDIFKALVNYTHFGSGTGNNNEIARCFMIKRGVPSLFDFLNLIISKRIISELDPDIIFLSCEYCYAHRELTYMARLMGKKTVALQHGDLNRKNYFFSNPTVKQILPDITCLFGEEYQRLLLEESVYHPKMLVITGNPRYDVLYYANKIYSKQKLIAKYNLDPHKKIVLWTTQTHGLALDENKKNIDAMYSAMNSLPSVQLVIKLHPNEDQNHPLYTENKSYKPIIIGGSEDTYGLINISDVVITRHSTTALEAIAMGKPLIIMNLSGEPTTSNYVTEGVGFGVSQGKDMKAALEKILQNKVNLNKNREKFIEKYLFRIDGKATNRVLEVIKRELKKANK